MFKQAEGWYLDLNSNGDIVWVNDITGEIGHAWQTREEAEQGGYEYEPEPCDICEYREACDQAGCGCIAP